MQSTERLPKDDFVIAMGDLNTEMDSDNTLLGYVIYTVLATATKTV